MRFAVLMQGVIRGMGRQENCELLATKTVSTETAQPVYSHCAIIEAPADLPDGEYEVEFGSEVAWTLRRNGSWTVGQTLPHSHSELTAFISAGNGPMGRPASLASNGDRRPRGAAEDPSSVHNRS